MVDRYKSCAKMLIYLALFLIVIVYFINVTVEYFREPIKAESTIGYKVDRFSQDPFDSPTSIAFTDNDVLNVATRGGEIFSAADSLVDGKIDNVKKIGSVPSDLLGIAVHKGRLFVSYTGAISELIDRDGDGVFETEKILTDGLPTGRHQNNGLAVGPDEKLYFTVGSTNDRGPVDNELTSTIITIALDGKDQEVFARGFRNPYDLVFDTQGRLFATDNGPDTPPAPDELNLVERGGHYGFPDVFGNEKAEGYIPPFALFEVHASANGAAAITNDYYGKELNGNIVVALFGNFFGDDPVGRKVVAIATSGKNKGKVTDLVTGLARPLDVATDKKGRLYIADFEDGHIYRVARNAGALGEDDPFADVQGSESAKPALDENGLPLSTEDKENASGEASSGEPAGQKLDQTGENKLQKEAQNEKKGLSTGMILLFAALAVLIIGIIFIGTYKGKNGRPGE